MDDDFLDELLGDEKNFAHLHQDKPQEKKKKGERIYNAFEDDGFNDLISSKDEESDSLDIGGYNPTMTSNRPPSRAMSMQDQQKKSQLFGLNKPNTAYGHTRPTTMNDNVFNNNPSDDYSNPLKDHT